MARQRNFSEPEVIDLATEVFSAHGFHGTSMNMLAESTGLGKQSLYNSFGDKQALYLQCMDSSVSRFSDMASGMHAAPTGYEAIQTFFQALVLACASPDPTLNTCMVSSGILESVDDASISLQLHKKWQSTYELLRSAIERGQRDGSISPSQPSTLLADMLMSMVSGLRVSARVDASPVRLQRSIDLTLSILKA